MKKSAATKSFELAIAAPQVVAHRLQRMSTLGPTSSVADYMEMHRMWSEKVVAFSQSWAAMYVEAFRFQQSFWTASSSLWLSPWVGGSGFDLTRTLWGDARAAERFWGKAIAPIHSKAVANSKRLGRAKPAARSR